MTGLTVVLMSLRKQWRAEGRGALCTPTDTEKARFSPLAYRCSKAQLKTHLFHKVISVGIDLIYACVQDLVFHY